MSETRGQKSRRMGWPEFETPTARFPAKAAQHSRLGAGTGYDAGYSREKPGAGIRPPGSVRAKTEWLSYSTTIVGMDFAERHREWCGVPRRSLQDWRFRRGRDGRKSHRGWTVTTEARRLR